MSKNNIELFSFSSTPSDVVVDRFMEIEDILAQREDIIPGLNWFKIDWPLSVEWIGWEAKRWDINFKSWKNIVKDIGFMSSMVLVYVYAGGWICFGSANFEVDKIKQSCVSMYKYQINSGSDEEPKWEEKVSFDMSPSRFFRVNEVLWNLKSIDDDGFTFESEWGGYMTYICYK